MRPAHCGELALVPPTTYQPVLHGAAPHSKPEVPSGGNVMYTSTPVRALAWYATSGTPRILVFGGGAPELLPTKVLPAGSVF